MSGPKVRLPPQMASALAMAFQALATNAVKDGALSNQTGHVAITWTKADRPARLCLRGSETGGLAVVEPPRRGFGSRLIERNLARDPTGHVEITFGESGAICTINARIDRTLRQSNWIPCRCHNPCDRQETCPASACSAPVLLGDG
ncbi:sensor histidine kinase [Methylobacterium nonmethylotrophicum]|uniref:histidine kinase n=1 Tax=Methylobacterium nonmethylotrophicum TaxID=1141884 RepID=A0A4Z0NC77_9HYPH|nr:sensor histidine kinase [Methylobacterium nonmethylotrophicum]